jgi:tripartite motif-containing protein 71
MTRSRAGRRFAGAASTRLSVVLALIAALVALCSTPILASAATFVKAWGLFGITPGKLSLPRGIAFAGGHVCVADTDNQRIQKFTADGGFVWASGSRGKGEGKFEDPKGIAADAQGHVYVADTWNDRIEEFNAGGGFVRAWGTYGTGDGQFRSPRGVAVADGHVYVADTGNQRIEKFTADGGFVSAWGGLGTGDGKFVSPQGIAVAGGKAYVVDTYGRIRSSPPTAPS